MISGLTADARSLLKHMRGECLSHRFVYGSSLQAERLVLDVADKHQRATQSYVRRPYGVGLLVAAFDRTGPHLFQARGGPGRVRACPPPYVLTSSSLLVLLLVLLLRSSCADVPLRQLL